MSEILNNTWIAGSSDPVWLLFWRIGIALVMGVCVVGLYRWACRGQSISPTFQTTLVLLATVISMATQVIGDNVARAFSLVGALSVVRFRTVVKDTQDTAFVIFAVVVGMAAGANNLAVAVVGLVVIGVAALILWPRRRPADLVSREAELTVRMGTNPEIAASVERVLQAQGTSAVMLGAGTASKGTLLEMHYRVRLRRGESPNILVSEILSVPGIEHIELRRL